MKFSKFDTWENKIKGKFGDSEKLLSDLWRGVFYKEKKKIRPKVIKRDLAGAYIEKSHLALHVIQGIAKREANLAISKAANDICVSDLNLTWSDDSIKLWCDAKAAKCASIKESSPMPAWEIRELLREYGMELPEGYLMGLDGAVERTCFAPWWRRRVRALKMRHIDELARSMRLVNQGAQNYCSDELVRLRRAQQTRNRGILEGMVASNQEGESYTLAELADLSTSNLFVKKSELMVRMRGFESLADDMGHQGIFITLTAPSAFHPSRQIKSRGRVVRVVDNPNWQGFTVRQAQDWLNKIWCRIRAAWNYREIRCYGFRVVEPHADGCPHWHLLLFFEPDSIGQAMSIFKKCALKEYGDEKGAAKYRVKIVYIDKSRGSATGYIAKYIAKNIDGGHIENDLFGNDAKAAAERIMAATGGHGVRQFQQVGGPSVQVWRELRRLEGDESDLKRIGGIDGLVELARGAADSSDWAAYCMVMGGVFVKRADMPIKIGRWIETKWNDDEQCYESIDKEINKYGEASAGKIYGLVAFGKSYLTRFYNWTIERMGRRKVYGAVELYQREKAQFRALFGLPTTPIDDELMQDLLRGGG